MHATTLIPTEALRVDLATAQLHEPPGFFEGRTFADYCRLIYYSGQVVMSAVMDTAGKMVKELTVDNNEPSTPAPPKEELLLFHDYPDNRLLRYPIRMLNAFRWRAYVMSTLTPTPENEDARLSRSQFEASISRNWAQLARGIGQASVRLAQETPLVVQGFRDCAHDSKDIIVKKIRDIRERRRVSEEAARVAEPAYIPIMPDMSGAAADAVFGSGTSTISAPIVKAVPAIETAF